MLPVSGRLVSVDERVADGDEQGIARCAVCDAAPTPDSAAENAVRAEVTNDGATGPEPRLESRPEVDAEHGRGLVLIDTVADRWGVTRDTDRTTVWAEFSY